MGIPDMSLFDTTKKKVITGVAALTIVALGGGLAYAYWSATGTGTGSATTGTSTNFTITSTAATGGLLTPGGPTDTVAFTVTNPGTGTQNLTAVTAAVATSTNGTFSIGTAPNTCTAADYTVGTPVITYGAIGPGASLSGTVTITMINSTTRNQDACKGAVVPLYFAAS
jgi:hypothetical protein